MMSNVLFEEKFSLLNIWMIGCDVYDLCEVGVMIKF